MKRNITVLLIVIKMGILFSCGGRETMKNETVLYNIDGFTGIDATGAFDIEVKKADQFSVSIVADQSLIKRVIVEKRGKKLFLGVKSFPRFSLKTKSPKVIITMPELNQIKLSGASKMKVKGFNSKETLLADLEGNSSLQLDMTAGDSTLKLSGNSKMTGDLSATDVIINMDGSSQIKLSGNGKDLIVDARGSTSGFLEDLSVENALIKLSGSSVFDVHLNGTLDIEASGSSRLNCSGRVCMGKSKLSGSAVVNQE